MAGATRSSKNGLYDGERMPPAAAIRPRTPAARLIADAPYYKLLCPSLVLFLIREFELYQAIDELLFR